MATTSVEEKYNQDVESVIVSIDDDLKVDEAKVDESKETDLPKAEKPVGTTGGGSTGTVRNLRIREDSSKFLLNLHVSSSHYDPKTRTMHAYESDDADLKGDEAKQVDFKKTEQHVHTTGGGSTGTVRNLRIREDTATYLLNLDANSAHYNPKTRSTREDSLPDAADPNNKFY